MPNFIHKELADGRWNSLRLAAQLAHIGSEVGRARRWQDVDADRFRGAVDRALDLFDLTLRDPRWAGRRVEIARVRELFCAAAFNGDAHGTTLADLERYFLPFAVLGSR